MAVMKCCTTTVALDGHWLVEVHQHCTCGAGGPEGHERACGAMPLIDLSGLPGWDALVESWSTSRAEIQTTVSINSNQSQEEADRG